MVDLISVTEENFVLVTEVTIFSGTRHKSCVCWK